MADRDKPAIYLAPMEGITGYIYRNALYEFFPYMRKYFTPFIAAGPNKLFTERELKDILPCNNLPDSVVPQILSCDAGGFTNLAKALKGYGYNEINLNLGCPSPTVVTKNRGAGMLKDPDRLLAFLDVIYDKAAAEDIRISIKTRLGMYSSEEFVKLLDIFGRFPVHELIIHPRAAADMYTSMPDLEMFGYAVERSKASLCYNGDIFTVSDNDRLIREFPSIPAVMCGRGILADPSLAGRIAAGIKPDRQVLKKFHDRIYNGYREVIPEEKNVLFKMKEIWYYMIQSFNDAEKYLKKIRKALRFCDYESAVYELFSNQQLRSAE